MNEPCSHPRCLAIATGECWYVDEGDGHVCANCLVPLKHYPELQHVFTEPGECDLLTAEQVIGG